MKSLATRAVALWNALERLVFDRLQAPLLLVLRGWWGWSFFTTGRGKLQNIEGIVDYFGSLHIPFPAANAHFVAWLETVGGLLLLAGLLARPAAALHAFSQPAFGYSRIGLRIGRSDSLAGRVCDDVSGVAAALDAAVGPLTAGCGPPCL